MTASRPDEQSLAAGFDRATAADGRLRRRLRELPAPETATGEELERRLDRLARVEGSEDELTHVAKLASGGDERARERLVAMGLPLIARIARRYAGRDVALADLVQEGVLGLLRGLERYDPGRRVPFGAYAQIWIRQAMQQAVAEQSRAVRLPRHVLWDMHDLKEARERLSLRGGRPPTDRQLGAELDWSDTRLADVLRAEAPPLSLDARMQPDSEATAGDLVEDPLATETFERVLIETSAGSIRALLSTLTDRERQLIVWRFGLEGEELSLREIGRRLGISRERVRQIQERALAKLRTEALPHDRSQVAS